VAEWPFSARRCRGSLRRPKSGLIHHTDRGGQYAGTECRGTLARARMAQSMSRADNCYDNAFMESCFGSLKTELEMHAYAIERIARKEIPDYIRYCNTRRRHAALEYRTPEEFDSFHLSSRAMRKSTHASQQDGHPGADQK
jgi:transposase InsO family protein